MIHSTLTIIAPLQPPSMFSAIPYFQPLLRMEVGDWERLEWGRPLKTREWLGTGMELKEYNDGLNIKIDLVNILIALSFFKINCRKNQN